MKRSSRLTGLFVALLGLMALLFYSSRMGYDEPPHRIESEDDRRS